MALILCLCPSHRDRRELPRLADGHELLFHDYASLELEQLTVPGVAPQPPIREVDREVDAILDLCRKERVEAVVSTDDYPGSALASIVAQELCLPGPMARASLISQHKYLSRIAQSMAAPECVPAFELIDVRREGASPAIGFPAFVKPVKSFFSVGAARVYGVEDLDLHRRRWRRLPEFFRPLDVLLRRYTGDSIGHECLIAEAVLTGAQSTLECYVHAGETRLLGVVDSIFHPGTLAFERFEYPSSLPAPVQDRMLDAAARVLRVLDYDNGMANIEFIHDPGSDALSIVEINPRMSSQFADLFEKVDGAGSYQVLLDLALGRRPLVSRGGGAHRAASSCVLRCFEDRLVRELPREEDLRELRAAVPDARIEILAEAGARLSEQMQDGCSFRYGIVNLGGSDREEILRTFDALSRRLGFVFGPAEFPCTPNRMPPRVSHRHRSMRSAHG